MKIKTITGVIADKRDIPAGKVIDLPDKIANFLISIGKAEKVEVKKGSSKKQ